jgi:nucleotide-binding universal stress UspA family protein
MNVHRLLVPLSLSPGSKAALLVAARTAERLHASIVLLHVVQASEADAQPGVPPARIMSGLQLEAHEHLRELVAQAELHVPWEIIIEQGRTVNTILAAAERLGVGAIFMSAHTCPRWLRWLHRNTALQVLRQAPCPIWILSSSEEEKSAVLLVVDRFPLITQDSRFAFPARNAEAFLSWCV